MCSKFILEIKSGWRIFLRSQVSRSKTRNTNLISPKLSSDMMTSLSFVIKVVEPPLTFFCSSFMSSISRRTQMSSLSLASVTLICLMATSSSVFLHLALNTVPKVPLPSLSPIAYFFLTRFQQPEAHSSYFYSDVSFLFSSYIFQDLGAL